MKTWMGALLVLVALSQSAAAKVVALFDIDGTIFNDRGPTSAWVTPWLLKRVEYLESMLQQTPNRPIEILLVDPEQIAYFNERYAATHPLDRPVRVSIQLPDQIGVSYDEFHRLQPWLAQSNFPSGGLTAMLLDFDPVYPERERLILPGYYRVFEGTFKYYREAVGSRPRNYLKQDWLQSRQRAQLRGEPDSWKGPAFALYHAFMSNSETVLDAERLTSRGQALKDYYGLDDEMLRQGELKAVKSKDGKRPVIYSLNQPESRVYGRGLAEQKATVAFRRVQALYHSGGEKHPIHVGSNLLFGHTLIVPEDEPSYVDAIADVFTRMSGSYYADRVQLVLYNAGKDEEVRQARYPWRFTVFDAGRRIRSASKEEIERWHDPKFLLQARTGTCFHHLASAERAL